MTANEAQISCAHRNGATGLPKTGRFKPRTGLKLELQVKPRANHALTPVADLRNSDPTARIRAESRLIQQDLARSCFLDGGLLPDYQRNLKK